MKNYWIDEVRVRKAVELLSKLLFDEFVGQMTTNENVSDFINDLIEALYAGDIVILNGLMKYVVALYFDDYHCIKDIKLINR